MSNKLQNDSTATFKPIIYQFYIALEKCFELVGDEKVYIEKYGDITVSDKLQIEFKDYKTDLTDLDHNIWKTLKNWLDYEFEIKHYISLILLTTQNFGVNTVFKDWNTKDKNQKKDTLIKIASNDIKSETTRKLIDIVMRKDSKDKLSDILEKFEIIDSQVNDDEFYGQLKEKYCRGILSVNQDDFINSLMGYIISPPITSNGWEITNNNFTLRFKALTEEYNSKAITFPKKYLGATITEAEKEKHLEYLFVKKIEDIDYYDLKHDAISDFINTRKTISNELAHYIGKNEYESYEEEIYRTYSVNYRNLLLDTDLSNQIKNSKKLYNNCTGSNIPNFRNFNDTPSYFMNGFLHEMADENVKDKIITWKIKVDDE